MHDEKRIDYSTRSELTDSLLGIFSSISDSDLTITIARVYESEDKKSIGRSVGRSIELSLSVGPFSWEFFIDGDKDGISHAEDIFLPKFRKCIMTFTGQKDIPIKEYERAIASHIRKPEFEHWRLMEKRIRSTFHEWIIGSGITRDITEYHKQNLKRDAQSHLLPLVRKLTRQEVLTLVGEIYDENLVKEVIES